MFFVIVGTVYDLVLHLLTYGSCRRVPVICRNTAWSGCTICYSSTHTSSRPAAGARLINDVVSHRFVTVCMLLWCPPFQVFAIIKNGCWHMCNLTWRSARRIQQVWYLQLRVFTLSCTLLVRRKTQYIHAEFGTSVSPMLFGRQQITSDNSTLAKAVVLLWMPR